MEFLPNNIYHIYNQGNNRQKIFLERNHYLIFLRLYKKLFGNAADTIAWCLMPNHFHFMVYTDERCSARIKQGGLMIDPVTNSVRKLLSGYCRIFNQRNNRSGSLFRQKTKAKCLSDVQALPENIPSAAEYYTNCFRYIHQNPLRANLVEKLEDWEFSSFRDYADMRNGELCKKELASLYCAYSAESFISESYELIPLDTIKYFR